jgi:hypothetical protein
MGLLTYLVDEICSGVSILEAAPDSSILKRLLSSAMITPS